MAKLAISYRRDDSMDITGRIFDRLTGHYGRQCVFRDIDSIPPGSDFREIIRASLDGSDILFVVVGPRWLGGASDGQARIQSDTDYVRFEIETALSHKIPIIPLLVGGANMPGPDSLPLSIRDFAYRHAVKIDSGRDFGHHMTGLIRATDQILLTTARAGCTEGRPILLPQFDDGLDTGPRSPRWTDAFRPAAAPARILPSVVGAVLIAQGVIHVVWLATMALRIASREQAMLMLQWIWTYADFIFGVGGIVVGIATVLRRDWAQPTGAALCILGILSEILMFIEFFDKGMERMVLAINILLLPLSFIGAYFYLFLWPSPDRPGEPKQS